MWREGKARVCCMCISSLGCLCCFSLLAVVPEILLMDSVDVAQVPIHACMLHHWADLNNVPGVGVYAFLPKTRMQIREES